jgi:tRNA dimethylallyltransferase
MITQADRAESRKAVLVAGPTGAGKSAFALRLARAWAEHGGARIINADSQQVYRELRVLTVRPTRDDEALVSHRLYGFLSVADPCSAGRWRAWALAEAEAAWDAGELPIFVGGTGLYFRALTRGLADIPKIPPAVRTQAETNLSKWGPGGLHEDLSRRDPVMAAHLDPADRQRVVRAWEVLEGTGVSLAEWQESGPDELRLPGSAIKYVLTLPRVLLRARIDERFRTMMAGGALAEVAALRDAGFDSELPAMKAQGVRALLRHLEGDITLDQAIALAQASTRQYAKRQMTWFRHQMGDWTWTEAKDSESFFKEIFPFICQFLLTAKG